MTQKLHNGSIWLANFNPTKGTEPGKTRPVLIIQSQPLLDIEHPSTLIIPLTTKLIDDAEPLRIRIEATDHLKQRSDLLIDQIRAIDNKRFTGSKALTTLSPQQMHIVYQAITDVIGSND